MKLVSDGDQPTPIDDDDLYTLKRYEAFREAAAYVSAAFERVPAVRRVVLFGSVASSPAIETRRRRGHFHEPKDVDLAVLLDGATDLNQLRKVSAQAVQRLWDEKEIGVAHHQVDIFLFDETETYIGRLCHFNQCPKHKLECNTPGCGLVPFLRQHDGFLFNAAQSLHPGRSRVLFERR
jgi:predicted nucleotidyltransferase